MNTELNIECDTEMNALALIGLVAPVVEYWNLHEKTGLALVAMRNEQGEIVWPVARASAYSSKDRSERIGDGHVCRLDFRLHGEVLDSDRAQLRTYIASFLNGIQKPSVQGENVDVASEASCSGLGD